MSFTNLLIGGLQLVAGIVLTASGVGGGLGLKLILSGALSLIAGFMSAKAGRGGIASSPTYGFDNLSNAAREGGPVPIGYGRHVFTPPIININPIQDGENQIIHLLCLLGEGEIDEVQRVYLNGIDTEKLPAGVYFETKRGTSDQTAFTQFSQIGTGYEAGTRLSKDVVHVHEMRVSCDALAMNFLWGAGFFKGTSSGGADEANIGIKVEYRAYGSSGAWIPFPAPSATKPTNSDPWYGDGTAGIFKIRGKTQASARRSLRLAFDGKSTGSTSTRPAAGRYSVRLTGTIDDASPYVRVPTVVAAVEIVSQSLAYANRALMAIKVPAIEQLGNSLPRVTVVAKWLKVYNPTTATTAWSDNPAWCVRDLLLSSRYGLGQWITSDMIDDGVGGTWRTVAAACDATVAIPGSTQTEKKHRLNYMLDVKNPASDYLTEMLTTFRATLFAADGKVMISQDTTGTTQRHFEDTAGAAATVRRNVQHEVGEGGYSDRSLLTAHVLEQSQRWNVVRANYIDADRDWTHRTLELRNRSIAVGSITGTYTTGEKLKAGNKAARFVFQRGGVLYYVQDDGDTALASGDTIVGESSAASCVASADPVLAESPERALEMNLFGITGRNQVVREMRYHLNRAVMTPILAQIPIGQGDIDLIPGDVIDVSSDFPGAWSEKLFTTLSLGFGQDGKGVLTAREYDASVFETSIDTQATDITKATPGGTGTTGASSSGEGGSFFGGKTTDGGGAGGFGTGTSTTPATGGVTVSWSGFFGSKK